MKEPKAQELKVVQVRFIAKMFVISKQRTNKISGILVSELCSKIQKIEITYGKVIKRVVANDPKFDSLVCNNKFSLSSFNTEIIV